MSEVIKINEQVSKLIKEHGYSSTIKGDKIIPDFKENIEIETWVYPQQKEKWMTSRLDVGVKLANGTELFESYGDLGTNLEDCIAKNLDGFVKGSLNVMLDAFNDEEKNVKQDEWKIGNSTFKVFIGDYNFKTLKKVPITIPKDLYLAIKELISQYSLNDDLYFVRFYYSQVDNKTLNIEFTVNNGNLEREEKALEHLDWMHMEEFYSMRHFMILKRIK